MKTQSPEIPANNSPSSGEVEKVRSILD